MAELPITQDALDVAEATMYALKGKPRSVIIEATVRSFLQAEGLKVERRGQFFPDEKRKGIQVHRDTEQRLVSPWKPIPE